MIVCSPLPLHKGKIPLSTLDFTPSLTNTLLILNNERTLEYRVSHISPTEITVTPLRKIRLADHWKQHLANLPHSLTLSNSAEANLRLNCTRTNTPPLSIRINLRGNEVQIHIYDPLRPSSFAFYFDSDRWKIIDKEIHLYRQNQNRILLENNLSIQNMQNKARELFLWIFPDLKNFDFNYRKIHVFSQNPPDFPLEWIPEITSVLIHLPGKQTLSPLSRFKMAVIRDSLLPYSEKEIASIHKKTVFPLKILEWQSFISRHPSLSDCNLIHISTHGEYRSGLSGLIYQEKLLTHLPIPKQTRLTTLNACSTARENQSIIRNILNLSGSAVIACPGTLPESVASQFPLFYDLLDPHNPELSFEIFRLLYPEIAVYYRYFKSIIDFI